MMEYETLCITCHAVRWALSPLCEQGAPYPRQNLTSKTKISYFQHLYKVFLPKKTNIQSQSGNTR